MVGVLGIVVCPLACLGTNRASTLLLHPQLLADLAEALDILIASSIGVLLLVLMGIGGVRTIKHALLHRELKDQGVTTQRHVVVDQWRTSQVSHKWNSWVMNGKYLEVLLLRSDGHAF